MSKGNGEETEDDESVRFWSREDRDVQRLSSVSTDQDLQNLTIAMSDLTSPTEVGEDVLADLQGREIAHIDPNTEGVRLRSSIRRLTNPCPDVKIRRPALTLSQLHDQYEYQRREHKGFRDTVKHTVKKKVTCSKEKARNTLFTHLPIVDWLILHYQLRRYLLGDVIAGITVAVMHIPQGMAYAMLAEVDPISGIYMAFFPVLVYAVLGTSRHCSMGSFAVICIMTGKVVNELSTPPDSGVQNTGYIFYEVRYSNSSGEGIAPIEVACIVSFAVGVWSTYQSIFQQILYSNPASMVISAVCIFVLVINNEVFKPRLRKYTIIPIPIELLVVIFGTLASKYGELNENFNISVVGDIPTGLPPFKIPRMDLLADVLLDSFVIAIVAYTISFSMAKIFAQRLDYNIDATQELYALGLSNIFGSFFECPPISASLSRSMIQQTVGGMTQLASFVSCSLLLLVLLFIGPFFEDLPNCVLASIIVVALKGMFLQVYDFTKMWKISRIDALLWLVTLLSVVIIDIDYGLMIGILASLLLLLWRSQTPKLQVLGRIPKTDIYLDPTRYKRAVPVAGICILQVHGSLHFANQDAFKSTIMKLTEIHPGKMLRARRKLEKAMRRELLKEEKAKQASSAADDLKDTGISNYQEILEDGGALSGDHIVVTPASDLRRAERLWQNGDRPDTPSHMSVYNMVAKTEFIIIDLGGVAYIDVSGAKHLVQLHKEFSEVDIVLALCSLTDAVQEFLTRSGALTALPQEYIFHSIHDAVLALSPQEQSTEPYPISRM